MKTDSLTSFFSTFKISVMVATCFVAVLGFSFHAQASNGIFEMADGSFYHPASGLKDATYSDLEARLLSAGLITQVTQEAPAVITTNATPAQPTVVLHILHMSDGQYFYPASGMLADTEAEIYASQGLTPPTDAPATDPMRSTPLLRAVDRAKLALRDKIEQDTATFGMKITPTDDLWLDVTLAVWNKSTDEISYVSAKKKGGQLEIAADNEDIFVKRSNYINSEYVVKDPNNIVIAVRYPILKSIVKNGVIAYYEMHDEAYTPYSGDLHTTEVVEAGDAYLNTIIDQAFSEMRSANITSRAYPGQLMADVVDKPLIKSLIMIEHTSLRGLSQDPKRAVEQVLVTLGLNTTDTYNYSHSNANAFGLAQFIPSTYASFVARTQLGLIPDFEAGLTNHVNAVRAMAAHLDDSLASLPSSVRQTGMSDDKVKEYLAAAYNGGYAKVRTAIQIWDEQISGAYQPYEILARSRLYPETISYVKKLRLALPTFKTTSNVQLTAKIQLK